MGFIVVIVILFAVAIAVAWYLDKQRREMWQAAARRYGFTYRRDDPYRIPDRYATFALFQAGHSRTASNCLEGAYQDVTVLLFDYRYKTGSGKNESTHSLSALMAQVGIACPYLLIRPETFFDKIGDLLGFADIDFEYEEFNRRFHVKSQDKRFAYDICHSGMMDFLLRHEKLTWEVSGDRLLLYGLGTFDPQEIEYCLDTAVGFLSHIPEYLRKG